MCGADVGTRPSRAASTEESIHRTGLMLSRQLILELIYWIPLGALLMSSLGLIALRRLSRLPIWLERVAALPFYFVSLPMATLLVGAEMLVWTTASVRDFGGLAFVLSFPFIVWLSFPVDPAGTLAYANSYVAPFAVAQRLYAVADDWT